MNYKKPLAALSALSLTLVACGTEESADNSADDYPERSVEMIVSFAAGGGTDLGARQLVPLVEDELGGADIQVVNRPGAGGWIGWDDLVNAEPDGHTLGYVNTPNLISGYLNPDLDRDNSLDDFTFIANQITDPLVVSIQPDEDRFNDIESLIEYAQENPLTLTATGVGGHQQSAALQLNQEYGTQFEAVQTEGAAEGMSQFLGGHIDLLFVTAGEAYQPSEQGEIEPIVVMSEKRSEFLEDVPTIEEEGFIPIYEGSNRGIAGPAGMSDELRDHVAEAFEAAITSDEHLEQMSEQGLQVDYMGPEEYRSTLEQQETALIDAFEELGWNN